MEQAKGLGSGRFVWVKHITGVISIISISAALLGALTIVVDVLGRWLFGVSVFALNEIMSTIFAIAIALTLPAGAANRVNLKIDLLAHHTGPRLTAWLKVAGSIMLFVFFAMLAWRLWGLAIRYQGQGRASALLQLPLAPTYFAIALAMAAAAIVQIFNTIDDLLDALDERGAERSHPIVWLLVAAFVVLVGAIALWSLLDFDSYSTYVMLHPGTAALVGFALLWLAVLIQLPLATVTALIGVGGTIAFVGSNASMNTFAGDAADFLRNDQVATLPMFLIMGAFSVAAGVSDDLFRLGQALLGRFRGGLAYATIAGCAGFGAVSGNSIATSATFGRMALPAMKQAGYAPTLSTASVAAGGTLGALVPPSGVIILFALLTETSIGDLFVAAMIPAVLAILLYFGAVFAVVRMTPSAVPEADHASLADFGPALRGSFPVVLMFTIVIGGLYGGLFTATESAAVGAISAFVLAWMRGRLTRATILQVFAETTATTAMIYALIFGGLMFAFFINLGGAPDMVSAWIASIDARPLFILALLIVIYLLLGSIMDSFGVMIITLPVVTPIILDLGYDMLFWGILMLVVVEIGMITPPFGMNLFIIKSIDPEVRLGTVMRGVVPFIIADFAKIIILVAFPALALWLPSTM
ncbi:TRAP transporter large permease [Flavimaricola marinus]|uniref:Sialic acid TRAP transporter permease protein SiaT n=1 Tax=Flavimaricola marinus TaxID=1819565 RepID=A0A238LI76_9RHOB|nr:TRAP transporter large permease subunit [Flavimaricola marinus]SMY09351.1 Sialic acid TRAP transporter permease protein SiaT [Flavimaricola marinus]